MEVKGIDVILQGYGNALKGEGTEGYSIVLWYGCRRAFRYTYRVS